jgi:hypothetical protein
MNSSLRASASLRFFAAILHLLSSPDARAQGDGLRAYQLTPGRHKHVIRSEHVKESARFHAEAIQHA